MEFEISSDQRTGKPIACRVMRLEAGSVSFEVCKFLSDICILLFVNYFNHERFHTNKLLDKKDCPKNFYLSKNKVQTFDGQNIFI